MMRRSFSCFLPLTVALLTFASAPSIGEDSHAFPDGWVPRAPRDELRPTFAYDPRVAQKDREPSSSRMINGRVSTDGCRSPLR